jgi:hypothetical protein
MKKLLSPFIIPVLLISLCTTQIKAQEVNDSTDINEAGLPQRKEASKQVLVIPFQPSMYFVTNDAFICKASNMKPSQLNLHIRSSLADKMSGAVSEDYKSGRVNDNSEGSGAISDVESIYKMTKYTVENKPLVSYYKTPEEKNSKNLWGMKGEEGKKHVPDFLKPKKVSMNSHKYYKATMENKEQVAYLVKKYNVSSFLFIDHFEMETHFKDCTALQDQVSKRDIYVHFTVLDEEGKYKDGGVVAMSFVSNSNDIKDILKNSLPSISKMIMTQVKSVL